MSGKRISNDNKRLVRSKPAKLFYQKWRVWLVITIAVIVTIMVFVRKEGIIEEPGVVEERRDELESEVIEEQEDELEFEITEEQDEAEMEVTTVEGDNETEDETTAENKVNPFDALPLETQFVVINSMMDRRILGWSDEFKIAEEYLNYVTYYEDIQRLRYQVHSGAGTGHPEYHWTIYDDRVTFEVGYVGSGANKLIKLLPKSAELATIKKADLYAFYVHFQNRFELWANEVEIEFASDSERNSERRFEEFPGETSIEMIEVSATDFKSIMLD